ncbi:hypothetical protein HYR69_07170 [Candidatus Sumerlaeota bacterium]|nr:hypothetical protein [Candidatus Sumerlaeota bacterium]
MNLTEREESLFLPVITGDWKLVAKTYLVFSLANLVVSSLFFYAAWWAWSVDDHLLLLLLFAGGAFVFASGAIWFAKSRDMVAYSKLLEKVIAANTSGEDPIEYMTRGLS